MISLQKTFINGLDLLKSDTQLDNASYRWLINARSRFGPVEPIKKHLKIKGPPRSGKYQEITTLGDILLLFVGGLCYYKLPDSLNWIQVPNFKMSAAADVIYTQAVPASNMNFIRKAKTTVNNGIDLMPDFRINGTPSGLVCQDGVSQPFIIEINENNSFISARQLKTYAQWYKAGTDVNTREYVPIGRQMMFLNGILFIVAPNGKSVYRSITGRPLDFMVNVDTNGNKLTTESSGGASSVSFAFDFDTITCLKEVNLENCFAYGTAKTLRIITLDYASTLFGEPRFRQLAVINDGTVNNNCFIEKMGDYVYINREGVKLFNAVQTYKFKGRNSHFSLEVSKLLSIDANTKIYQQNPCCTEFNNYLIFCLDTKYGNAMVIYDDLLDKWVSFDITEVADIRKFAILDLDTESELYCITASNEIYQLFGGTTTEVAMLRTKSWTASTEEGYNTSVNHKSNFLRALFNSGTFNGTITAIELVDEQESVANRTTLTLESRIGGVPYPVRGPVGPFTENRVNDVAIPLTNGLSGSKISLILIWDNDSQLIEYELETSVTKDSSSSEQKQATFNSTYATTN